MYRKQYKVKDSQAGPTMPQGGAYRMTSSAVTPVPRGVKAAVPPGVVKQNKLESCDSDTSATSDCTFVDKGGNSSLHLCVMTATSCEPERQILRAIAAGCDVNASNKCGSRPLHLASEMKLSACADVLIQNGAQLDVLDGSGMSPLMRASRTGANKVVTSLLAAGANVSLANKRGETALQYAAARGHHCIVESLLKYKAKVNYPDKHGRTPLSFACQKTCLRVVELLLASGAKPDKVDDSGQGPLHLTAIGGTPECARALIQAGASLDLMDKNFSTPFLLAIFRDNVDVLKVLIDAGCDRSTVDGLNGSALALAALKGLNTCVNLLLDAGDDPDEFGFFALTPLMSACFESHVDVIDTLLERGADPGIVSRMGATAIHAAMLKICSRNEKKRHVIVAQLIRYGVDVDHRVTYGGYFASSSNGKNCPLSFALSSGYKSIVRMLVMAGCHVTCRDVRDLLHREDLGSFYNIEDLVGPLKEYKTQTLTLKHTCRLAIRGLLGKRPHPKVKQLPLPSELRGYVDFRDLDLIPCQKAEVKSEQASVLTEFAIVRPCSLTVLEGTFLHQSVRDSLQGEPCDCDTCRRLGLTKT